MQGFWNLFSLSKLVMSKRKKSFSTVDQTSLYKFSLDQIENVHVSSSNDASTPGSALPYPVIELIDGLNSPLPRSGHRIICYGSDLYVFGGYNNYISPIEYKDESWQINCPLFKELWKFNMINKRWTRLKNLPGMPDELASHSAVAVPPCMLVYGGTSTPFGDSSSNSVHLCYLPKGEWTTLNTEGRFSPVPMYGQAICLEKDELFVVGGTTGFQYSMDVHVLNLKTLKWQHLVPDMTRSQAMPDTRYRHEITYHKNCLYIFGGGTNEEAFPLDSIPTFDLEHLCWRFTQTHPDSVTKEFPAPRKCHALVKYKNYVYIHGGTNETENLRDFWRFNLDTSTWQLLQGKTRKPIYFHSASVTQEGTMYLFGGIWDRSSTRTNKVFKVHIDVPSLSTMAWEALDHYATNLDKLSRSKLLELGIPRYIVDSLKSVSDVG